MTPPSGPLPAWRAPRPFLRFAGAPQPCTSRVGSCARLLTVDFLFNCTPGAAINVMVRTRCGQMRGWESSEAPARASAKYAMATASAVHTAMWCRIAGPEEKAPPCQASARL